MSDLIYIADIVQIIIATYTNALVLMVHAYYTYMSSVDVVYMNAFHLCHILFVDLSASLFIEDALHTVTQEPNILSTARSRRR